VPEGARGVMLREVPLPEELADGHAHSSRM
jgi:hypothetical protein